MIDEMSLSEGVAFNSASMEIQGFVDLGKFTPSDQMQERGNHALVFMCQPFKEPWVQVGIFVVI